MAVNRAKFLFSCTKNVLFLQHALLCLSCSQEAHENANPLQGATQIWRNDLIAASRPTAISAYFFRQNVMDRGNGSRPKSNYKGNAPYLWCTVQGVRNLVGLL